MCMQLGDENVLNEGLSNINKTSIGLKEFPFEYINIIN